MTEEFKYRNITYLIGISHIVGVLFGVTKWGELFDILFDLVALIGIVTCYMWLRKTVVLFGLFFYFLSFNFALLFNPLLPYSGKITYQSFSFFIRLELIAFVLVVAGLVDSYLNNRFLHYKSKLTLAPIIVFLTSGIAIIQILVRMYG